MTLTLLSIFFSMLLCFLLPLGCVIFFCLHKNFSWKNIGIGSIVFIISEILIKLPIMDFLFSLPAIAKWMENPWLYIFIISAGNTLFFLGSIWIIFKTVLKTNRTIDQMAEIGIGYCAAELIILNGIGACVSMIQSLFYKTNNAVWYEIIIGSLEKIFIFIVHIFFFLMMAYILDLKKKKFILWIFTALSLIIIQSLPLIMVQIFHLSYFYAEGYFFILSLLCVLWMILKRKNTLFVYHNF